jgi:iron(III) transport system substrate-binding protein
MKAIQAGLFAALCLLAFFSTRLWAANEVNIYSARHYDTDIALYKDFEKRTGIKVNLIEAASDSLIERIANEGKYSPADILITVDAGRLYRAEQRGIFAPFKSQVLEEKVPLHLRHPEGLWYGLSKRARVIIYNSEKGKPAELNNYEDLADPRFKGKLCMRSSSNIYNISLMSALVDHLGEEKAEQWAKGVVANIRTRPKGNDTSNIRSVASGECEISLINSYYLARMIADGDKIAQKVGVLYPNQSTSGTHVNISGAGVLKYSPNRENAIRFIEYLTENSAQKMLVEGNNEYPVVKDASLSEALAQMGPFKEDTINASVLGKNQAAAVRVFDRAGWH